MKVKVTVYSYYIDGIRICHLTVDFEDDLKSLVDFLTMILLQNRLRFYEYFTPRQRARIVGTICKVTLDKFIN